MFRLESANSMPLTKQIAEDHFRLEPSPTERSLDPSRLKYLHEKAQAKQLVSFQWARAKCGTRVMRMNGQHSSTMLTELNGEFPEGLFVHLDTYTVDTEADLALLFRQFDARKSSRNAKDVAGAYQGLHAALRDVPRPFAKLAVEGIAFFLRHVVGSRSLAGDDQYTLFDEDKYHEFIRWLGCDIHSVKTPEMMRPPVAAAMYATFEINETAAREFWKQVARGGDEFDENAPTTILDNWLKRMSERDSAARIKPAHYYQGAIFAWNAHREDKHIKDIRSNVDKGFLEPTH